MKVLVVEDALGMRKIVAAMLRNLGYDDVVTAENGSEALDLMRGTKVDMLLTNWDMPVLDGVSLVQQLRGMPRYAEVPVLLFTSRQAKEDVVKALKAGIDGYLSKPFTPAQLRDQLKTVFERRVQRRVARIVAGIDPVKLEDEHPLLLIGDTAGSRDELMRPDRTEVVDLLSHAVDGVEAFNRHSQEVQLGIALDSDSGAISKRVKTLGERVKAILVSTRLPGGGVTMARLASVNRRSDLSIFIVSRNQADIPERVRRGLDHMGVTILQGDNLDAAAFEQIATEHVVAKVRSDPGELPAPEIIRERLELDIRLTVSLPVLPKVFSDVTQLARNADSDIHEWIQAIEADPLSRAQVIRKARSPMYGFQGQVDEAGKAIILLGKEAIKQLIVSEAVMRSFQSVEGDEFSVEEYWLHSVAVALTARLLSFPTEPGQRTAEQQKEFDEFELIEEASTALAELNLSGLLPLEPGQDPFIAGMMHDIGKVALATSYPGLYPRIVETLKQENWDQPMLYGEEICAGGANHCEVGRILAESWKLGDDVGNLVARHHQPAGDPLVKLVAVADFLAGGTWPYPQNAEFPMARHLRGQKSDEIEEAARRFLPDGFAEELGVEMSALIELGWLLGPAIIARVEAMREGL